MIGDSRITSASTERQKRSQDSAPVLVIISGNSLVFSRKIMTSTGFTGAAPPARQHSSGKKSVSHVNMVVSFVSFCVSFPCLAGGFCQSPRLS